MQLRNSVTFLGCRSAGVLIFCFLDDVGGTGDRDRTFCFLAELTALTPGSGGGGGAGLDPLPSCWTTEERGRIPRVMSLMASGNFIVTIIIVRRLCCCYGGSGICFFLSKLVLIPMNKSKDLHPRPCFLIRRARTQMTTTLTCPTKKQIYVSVQRPW
jgi:hypothetical protein